MKRYCRILLFILTVILILSLTSTVCLADGGLDNFKKDAVYTPGRFADVASSAWYANSVKDAYEYGLVKGTSDTTFNPTGNITIAEAITLAARLNSIYYTGSANFVQGMPWYQVFVDYAVNNGIIRNGEYSDYNAKATRAQFATIFAAAMPEAAFAKINSVEIGSLPDVSGYEAYGSAVYKLYNAGILTGNDDFGTFLPASNIQRSEVAAIVTRMADTSLRKAVNLKPVPVVPQSIVLSESTITLTLGQSKKLTATVLPANATDKEVSWYSIGSYYVDLSPDGTVTGKNVGRATITAVTSNGLEASCTIVVEPFSIKVATQLPFISTYCGRRCKITDCWVTYEKKSRDYTIYVHMSGENIGTETGRCGCRFKVYNSEGYVIGSGTFTKSSLSPGDKFKDSCDYDDIAMIPIDALVGECTLVLYNEY